MCCILCVNKFVLCFCTALWPLARPYCLVVVVFVPCNLPVTDVDKMGRYARLVSIADVTGHENEVFTRRAYLSSSWGIRPFLTIGNPEPPNPRRFDFQQEVQNVLPASCEDFTLCVFGLLVLGVSPASAVLSDSAEMYCVLHCCLPVDG